MAWNDLQWHVVRQDVVAYTKCFMQDAGFEKVVLGLSGGIDSALIAHIAVEALGAENVLAYMLPDTQVVNDSVDDALIVAENLNISHEIMNIRGTIDSYFDSLKDTDVSPLRRGNKCARERMSILYDQASLHDALVIGTGNKTEALLGYTTLWGDMACAFSPIGDLWKYQVRELSKWMNVPKEIIENSPSAGLWEGQTDEDELGFTYDVADFVLNKLLLFRKYSPRHNKVLQESNFVQQMVDIGMNADTVRKIRELHDATSYKRHMPDVCRADKSWLIQNMGSE